MKLHDDLGIPEDATPEQVKAAHHRAIKRHHPDTGGDREKFQSAQHAYEVLIVPERRKRYEESGDEGQARHVDPEELAKRQALATLGQMIVQLSLQPNSEFRDLVAEAMQSVRAGMQQASTNAAQKVVNMNDAARRLEKIAKRIRRKKGKTGEDQILTILTAQIASFRLEAAQATDAAKQAKDVGERVLAILQEYEFDREKQQALYGSPTMQILGGSSGW
jgi:curved DNA-binding protein CbpA